MVHDLNPKNLHINELFFLQNPSKPYFGGVFAHRQNEIFSRKYGSISFSLLKIQ